MVVQNSVVNCNAHDKHHGEQYILSNHEMVQCV